MNYVQCKRCVMDTTDPEIIFKDGVCNYCLAYDCNENKRVEELVRLHEVRIAIEKDRNEYDCLIGLSGGVDSSYLLHIAIQLGLKPLAYSIDNGWNDPRADENIMRLVEGLKVPFYRYTIDTDKFRELQSAFIKSGTKNVEIPTDHILMASAFEMANKYGLKWILSGGNIATENTMPYSWGYQARDLRHIRAIYKKFTGKKLTGLPLCSLPMFNYYRWFKGIKTVYLLDFFEYNRDRAIKTLKDKYGYKEYGEKHCESIWTQWFQNFYLFKKFGIDKRKAHLSSLIHSGQMTREQAMNELTKSPIYPELGIENRVLKYPKHSYKDYPNSEFWWNFNGRIIRFIRKYGNLSRRKRFFNVA